MRDVSLETRQCHEEARFSFVTRWAKGVISLSALKRLMMGRRVQLLCTQFEIGNLEFQKGLKPYVKARSVLQRNMTHSDSLICID